jgi:DNA primase
MQAILETRTRALFDVLIEREEQQGPPVVTPDQAAALEARLKRLVETITDADVKARYAQELRQTLWAKSRKLAKALAPVQGRRQAGVAEKRRDNTQVDWRVRERANERVRLGSLPRAASTQAQGLAARSNELSEQAAAMPPRETLLMATLMNHPWLLEGHCEDVAGLTLTSEPLRRLKDALLMVLSDGSPLDHATVRTHLSNYGLDSVAAAVDRATAQTSDKFGRPEASASEAEAGWRHALVLHEVQVALPLELKLAERAWREEQSEEAWERIVELQDRLARGLAEAPALSDS